MNNCARECVIQWSKP